MKKLILTLTISLFTLSSQIAYSADQERINLITQEVKDRGLQDYLNVFENFNNYGSASDQSLGDSMVDALDNLTRKYPTVSKLYRVISDLTQSEYYSHRKNGSPLIMLNLYGTLQMVKKDGYRKATIDEWDFVTIKDDCGYDTNVYYTTVTLKGKKDLTFGFMLSAGYGYVEEKYIKSKAMPEECP